jgi:hypothetical protein
MGLPMSKDVPNFVSAPLGTTNISAPSRFKLESRLYWAPAIISVMANKKPATPAIPENTARLLNPLPRITFMANRNKFIN